jgi:NAD(P)-dependent dehydrogenase (short-subunit alcohol dehydrogenase family)
MDDLENKTAVITGAASGIGLGMAVRFGRAGMNVVLADVEEPALADAVAAVEATGAAALAQRVDVRHLDEVEGLLAAAVERFGRVHLVCNNAGIAGPFGKTSWELSARDWEWVIGVDLWGVIHGVRVFTPHLVAHGDGHIVNTASLAGHTTGTVVPASYHTAKHGVVALSECLFGELAQRAPGVGVTVLVVELRPALRFLHVVGIGVERDSLSRPFDVEPVRGNPQDQIGIRPSNRGSLRIIPAEEPVTASLDEVNGQAESAGHRDVDDRHRCARPPLSVIIHDPVCEHVPGLAEIGVVFAVGVVLHAAVQLQNLQQVPAKETPQQIAVAVRRRLLTGLRIEPVQVPDSVELGPAAPHVPFGKPCVEPRILRTRKAAGREEVHCENIVRLQIGGLQFQKRLRRYDFRPGRGVDSRDRRRFGHLNVLVSPRSGIPRDDTESFASGSFDPSRTPTNNTASRTGFFPANLSGLIRIHGNDCPQLLRVWRHG